MPRFQVSALGSLLGQAKSGADPKYDTLFVKKLSGFILIKFPW
jgi:hypothetical protein